MKKILFVLLALIGFNLFAEECFIQKEWGMQISYEEDLKNGYFSKNEMYDTFKKFPENGFKVSNLDKFSEYEFATQYMAFDLYAKSVFGSAIGEDVSEAIKETFETARSYSYAILELGDSMCFDVCWVKEKDCFYYYYFFTD